MLIESGLTAGNSTNASLLVSQSRKVRSGGNYGCRLFLLAVITVTFCATPLESGCTAVTSAKGHCALADFDSVSRTRSPTRIFFSAAHVACDVFGDMLYTSGAIFPKTPAFFP